MSYEIDPLRTARGIRNGLVLSVLLWIVVILGAKGCGAQEQEHQFWDTHRKISTAVQFSLKAMDSGQTCYALSHGYRELELPTQKCGVAVGILAGSGLGVLGLDYALHKLGFRHLSRLPQWISSGSAAGAVVHNFRLFTQRTDSRIVVKAPSLGCSATSACLVVGR